jgi:hypothetical protein
MLETHFVDAVVAAVPTVLRLVPPTPAAVLGRAGVDRTPAPHGSGGRIQQSEVLGALRQLPISLTERLLGALELSVAGIDVNLPQDTTGDLPTPITGAVSIASSSTDTETITAVNRLDALAPGVSDFVLALARELIDQPAIASVLRAPTGGDEAAVAAAHGARYVGLTVVVAAAVVRALPIRPRLFEAAVVGLALGCAHILLREVPMPDSYAAAVLAGRRADYRYPRSSSCAIEIHDHRFALAADPTEPAPADFAANGLVTAIEGGTMIRTGLAEGQLHCAMQILAEPESDPDVTAWDEVVDISWRTSTGDATLPLPRPLGGSRPYRPATPPWPGDYRLRVYATGRDGEDTESYRLVIWQQPIAPEVVHRRTDRLGHRLRGETQPDSAPRRYWPTGGWNRAGTGKQRRSQS